jgi:hypothetical protein
MEKLVSRLRELVFFHDSEPLELMGGIFRLMTPFHLGLEACSLSLMLTGMLSSIAALSGDLKARSLANLVGVTVPVALILTDVKGWDANCLPDVVFTLIISAWCLTRTMSEMNSRSTK